MTTTRPEVPATLAARPWDERRNLPVPVVSEFPDGVNFAAINGETSYRLGRERRCALCGEPMGYWVAFVGGPRSADFGSYSDGPMHIDCAEAAIKLCPHICMTQHRRLSETRQMQLTAGVPVTVPDGWVEDKPSSWVLYITRDYKVRMLPTADGGVSPIYIARPAKTKRTFNYDDTGRIRERHKF